MLLGSTSLQFVHYHLPEAIEPGGGCALNVVSDGLPTEGD